MTAEFIPRAQLMLEALELAKKAGAMGEIPVGAVVELNGEIIGRGFNTREREKNPLGHAEIMAISQAAATVGDWRLTGANLYVTLEPCPMCTGAAINSRIQRIIFGTEDLQAGCCGSTVDLCGLSLFHKPKIYRGFMASECQSLIKAFFEAMRKKG